MTQRAARRLRGVHVLADDDPRWSRGPVEQARAACAGGAAVVQLRCKHSTDRETLACARAIRALTRTSRVLFVVNDRFDLALLADADGVHLGQDDLPPAQIPEELRKRLLVGRSTHTLAQVRAARAEPVDYIAFGPVYGTRSKTSAHAARGIARLRRCARLVAPTPLVAIGGIDAERAAQVAEAGADAIAVISAVAAAEDMQAATRDLVEAVRAETVA